MTAEPPTEPQSLPDINAQTYPFQVVEAWLNQAAYFNLLSVSSPAAAPVTAAGRGVLGWRIEENLHRFVVDVAQPTRQHPLRSRQRVGERLGTFSHRWPLIPHDFEALPGREPPPTVLDPSRSQRFVMLESECRFGDGRDGFRGFGTGLTLPAGAGGSGVVYAGAVGTVLEGFGKFAGHEQTTYTYCGTLDPEKGFQGSLMIRAMDFEGNLATRRELPPLVPEADPESGVTYVVLHGRKPSPDSKTLYNYGAGGQVTGLEVYQELMVFPLDAAVLERGGLVSTSSLGRVIGTMRSDIAFNLFDPGAPGTATAPIPFSAYNEIRLFDDNGEELGTFGADGGEGRTFLLSFPMAPTQQGLRFGGFGPLKNGTGSFRGIRGLMTDNSVVGIAPHVTSTLYVLRVQDEDGRYREALSGGPAPGRPAGLRPAFRDLVREKEAFMPTYRKWRRQFRRCAGPLGRAVAEAYNSRLGVGDFQGLEIDPDALSAAFAAEVAPFDAETFERYRGRAKGIFKTYRTATNELVNTSELYSVWSHDTHRIGARHAKEITGSHVGYFDPGELPDLSENKVDLLVNSYHPETGVTSWVSMYQRGRRIRASIAYKLPHGHEVLWIVKEVSTEGGGPSDYRFMASHEWKQVRGGRVTYPMVGLFFAADFERGTAGLDGDFFWKALYEEES